MVRETVRLLPRRAPGQLQPGRPPVAGTIVFGALLFTLILLPAFSLTISAFAGRWPFPQPLPQELSIDAWRYIWTSARSVIKALAVSTAYSTAVALLSAAVCWPAARFLAQRQFAGQAVLEAVLLSPALIPSITFSMGIQVIFIRIGLVDTTAGVILVLSLTAYPYVLRALKTGFLAVSSRYDDCAQNLGAGRLQRLVELELPMVLPSALAGMSVAFLVAFSEYFLVYLIGGGVVAGFTGLMVPFLLSSDRQTASALTLVFVLVPLLLFFVQERFLQRFYVRKGVESA